MDTHIRFRISLLTAAFGLLLFASCTTFLTPRSQRASDSAVVIPNMPMLKWGVESCGAGSLSTVLQHYGDVTSMQAWDAALPKVHGGVMTVDLLIAARQKGFDAQIVTADREFVRNQLMTGHPVILMLKVIDSLGHSYDFFHYIVVDGIDPARGLIRAQFGDRSARWVRFDRLENAWAGGAHTAILITPHDALADSMRAAVELEDQGKYGEAATQYREIIASHPDSAVAWTNLGNAYTQLKQNEDAEAAFRKALEIAPTSRDALNNLSWLLYQQHRLPEAEALARRAIAQPGPDSYQIGRAHV